MQTIYSTLLKQKSIIYSFRGFSRENRLELGALATRYNLRVRAWTAIRPQYIGSSFIYLQERFYYCIVYIQNRIILWTECYAFLWCITLIQYIFILLVYFLAENTLPLRTVTLRTASRQSNSYSLSAMRLPTAITCPLNYNCYYRDWIFSFYFQSLR